MKLKTILLAGVCGIALCGCLSYPTGYGPHGTRADLTAPNPGVKRDITFSLDYSSSVRGGGDSDGWVVAIREQLAASGLFGRIEYTKRSSMSPYHYHFKVAYLGNRADHGKREFARETMTVCSLLTLGILPAWAEHDVNCTMSYWVKGKEVYSTSSQQTRRTIIWVPGVVVFPFIDCGSMSENALRYFVREIRDRKLNDIQ